MTANINVDTAIFPGDESDVDDLGDGIEKIRANLDELAD